MEDSDDEHAESPSGLAGSPPSNVTSGGSATRTILFALVAIFGGIFGWFFTSIAKPEPSVVESLAQNEFAAAIPTLNGESRLLALRKASQCQFPLGIITVSTPGYSAGGTVSFRTSKYTSPKFHVSDKPQQIAIPNPLPETGGIDPLTVDGNAPGLIVSLYPTAWMQPVNGTKTIPVRWHARPCK